MLLTSNFYSILYYNCEIWLSNGLTNILKQRILSVSSQALLMLNNSSDLRTSFNQLHKLEKRAPPMEFVKYRLAIQLFKIYNGSSMDKDWIDMNIQQNFNARQTNFHITDSSRLKVGKNIISNRMTILNNKINLDWLNLSLTSFKLKIKSQFLMN